MGCVQAEMASSTAVPATATFPPAPTSAPITPSPQPLISSAPLPSPTPTAITLYVPLIGGAEPLAVPSPSPTAVSAYPYPVAETAANTPPPPTPPPSPTPTPTPIPTLDFAAIRADLEAQGQTLAFSKLGFHTSIGGNQEGLHDWMRRLDAAGVPFFIKSADNAEPILFAQELMKASGVPHVLVYRRSGDEFDLPNYELPPAEAAVQHWQLHRAVFPPELDPSVVWLETINEPDKNRAEWLAEFALVTADLALAEGFRWAAFGWASGEPEMSDWQSPPMLRFLALVAEHPQRLAISLHEYSYLVTDIRHEFPYKIGRFQFLFDAADAHAIPRPTLLITEWGWTYQHVPPPEQAMLDVAWAAELYAPHPQILGAAIWHLGCCYDPVHTETQRLILPLTIYSLGHYFVAP